MDTNREDVERFANVLRALVPVLPPVPSRTHRHHAGALLADVALQAGVNYFTVVRPRVQSIVERFPDATTVAAFESVVLRHTPEEVLQWRHSDKLDRFRALLALCRWQRLDTVDDISMWVATAKGREQLLALRGIGQKSVDYLRALCGFETIPVDRHWLRLVALAGIRTRGYGYARAIIEQACSELGLPVLETDLRVWLLSRSC